MQGHTCTAVRALMADCCLCSVQATHWFIALRSVQLLNIVNATRRALLSQANSRHSNQHCTAAQLSAC